MQKVKTVCFESYVYYYSTLDKSKTANSYTFLPYLTFPPKSSTARFDMCVRALSQRR